MDFFLVVKNLSQYVRKSKSILLHLFEDRTCGN